MAMRATFQRNCCNSNKANVLLKRFTHGLAISPSFNNSIDPISSPPLSLPEPDTGFQPLLPGFSPDLGSMDLMAVPKKKISKSRRGIRNGPKALKPVPVIVRCMCCGRVKLPHFYCCGGRREEPRERGDANH